MGGRGGSILDKRRIKVKERGGEGTCKWNMYDRWKSSVWNGLQRLHREEGSSVSLIKMSGCLTQERRKRRAVEEEGWWDTTGRRHRGGENGGSQFVWSALTSFNLPLPGLWDCVCVCVCLCVFFTITLSDSAANQNRRDAPHTHTHTVSVSRPLLPHKHQPCLCAVHSTGEQQRAGLVSLCRRPLRPPRAAKRATRCVRHRGQVGEVILRA